MITSLRRLSPGVTSPDVWESATMELSDVKLFCYESSTNLYDGPAVLARLVP